MYLKNVCKRTQKKMYVNNTEEEEEEKEKETKKGK
jgi:hypothetical protein